MLSTDNTEASTDSMDSFHDPNFDFISSNFCSISTSTSQSDLFGFHCNNSIASTRRSSRETRYPDYSRGIDVGSYPSPSPTTSNPKRSVPLPSLSIGGGSLTGVEHKSYGGILDSPLVENHVLSRSLTPISPPTTVPTCTWPLPLVEEPLEDSSEDDQQALLSPLSPDWASSPIDALAAGGSDGSVLLSDYRLRRDSLDDLGLRNHEDDDLWMHHSPASSADDEDTLMGSPSDSPSSLKEDVQEPISFLPPFPHPSSPSIHRLNLDYVETPDSPSWSPSSLPELDMDSDDSDSDTLLTPPSPSSKPLSLPGAEEVHDNVLTWTNSVPDIFDLSGESPKSQSLLLIEDPDVPPPRSPSPDPFDLDPSIHSTCSDPDVERLLGLRRKFQMAERSAKEVEERSLSQGCMFQRAEARKTRKKEKERVKEVSAMLRLMLEDRDLYEEGSCSPKRDGDQMRCRCPSPEVKRTKLQKASISSMPQLVARMTIRRRDGSDRPITHMPTLPTPKPASSLRQAWTGADLEEENEDEDESDDNMGLDASLLALKGFDDFSPPPISPILPSESWGMVTDGK